MKNFNLLVNFVDKLSFIDEFSVIENMYCCQTLYPKTNKKQIVRELKSKFQILHIENNSNTYYILFEDFVFLFIFGNTKYSGYAHITSFINLTNWKKLINLKN